MGIVRGLRCLTLALAMGRTDARITRPPATSGAQPLTFFGIADWGGQNAPPYVTEGQLEVAEAMGTVAGASGDHPMFVLGAGDNFYMDGLPG